MGNKGARSSGLIGCFVAGCKTGGKGPGKSARILYQYRGISFSSRIYLTCSIIIILSLIFSCFAIYRNSFFIPLILILSPLRGPPSPQYMAKYIIEHQQLSSILLPVFFICHLFFILQLQKMANIFTTLFYLKQKKTFHPITK